MHAHPISEARDAQAGQSPGGAHRLHGIEQLDGAMLRAFGHRDAHEGAVGEQQRFRQPAAFEHVEPVGQQGRGLVRMVALPHRRRQQGRQHAGEAAAAAQLTLGARQGRAQQVLGEQHLPFPQVGERDDELAPAVDVLDRMAEVSVRRLLLLMQARQRRVALEQGAVGRPVGVHVKQQAVVQRRLLAPGVVKLGEAVRLVREDRRAAQDERAFAAQRIVGARLRQQTLHQAASFLVTLADRERPGSRQQRRTRSIPSGPTRPRCLSERNRRAPGPARDRRHPRGHPHASLAAWLLREVPPHGETYFHGIVRTRTRSPSSPTPRPTRC